MANNIKIDFTKFSLKNKKHLFIYYAIALIVVFLVYYVTLPPIHYASAGFWVFLTFILALAFLPFTFKFIDKYNAHL